MRREGSASQPSLAVRTLAVFAPAGTLAPFFALAPAFMLAPLAALALALTLAPTMALAHEDPSDRIRELTSAIESHPSDSALYARRADLYRERGAWPEALADLQHAKSLDPALAGVDILAARVLFESGSPQAALEATDRALASQPTPGAHLLRARILAGSGADADAAREFTIAIDLERAAGRAPQPEDYLERANALAKLSQTDEALRGLDEGITTLGGAVALQLRAVELETERGNWDAALARLRSIESAANRKEPWIVRRAQVLERAGRTQEAEAAWTEARAALDRLPERLRNTGSTRELSSTIDRGLAALASRSKS
jgi:tetratricopeptide (TPR) repeat protein